MANDLAEMEGLTDDQLDARLAVYMAVLKVATAGKKAAMQEAERRMRAAVANGGRETTKRDVIVDKVRCGYLTRNKDSVTVYDEDEYGAWAASHGRGHKYLRIDVTGNDELEQVLTDWCDENDVECHVVGRADADVKKGLVIRDGRVLSWDGEIVPGAGVRPGALQYKDCKPDEVARVLQTVGLDMSVTGFLEA